MTKWTFGNAVRTGAIAVMMLVLAGCTHNPLLGKWTIASRDKEENASFLDELTQNVRASTGATTIEFLKDSIIISGGPQSHTINGVSYVITELEGGATTVQIVQAIKDPDNNDVDVCHVDKTGNAAQLQSRNEILTLSRAAQ